jgi:hypothetical protein
VSDRSERSWILEIDGAGDLTMDKAAAARGHVQRHLRPGARHPPGRDPLVTDGSGTTERFLNRELSWLAFNERVLEEAADKTTPLVERFKSCHRGVEPGRVLHGARRRLRSTRSPRATRRRI